MPSKHILVITAILTLLNLPVAQAKDNLSIGVAYDLDAGLTAQYKGYSFFLNGDAIAVDFRFQNFHNDRKTMHFYVDLGAFIDSYDGNDSTRDDSVGVRAPLGMIFGLEKNLQAYIQAVPSYDFEENGGFDVDGAIGIRYRF